MNASIPDVLGMALPLLSAPTAIAASTPADDSFNKKIRKPYTITKSRESWTDLEHDKFLEALQLFDRDWKKIEAFVGSKTVIQIRSHAQKYFLKVQKNGTGEHVPPPRPKRKSAQPYPQKASKSDVNPGNSIYKGNCYSSDGSSALNITQQPLAPCKIDHDSQSRATPDFAEIYTFLGNVFDSATTGHLNKLKDMAPINRETILLLMRNLSINLSSTEFEEHKLSSSVYDMSMLQPSAVTGHA